MGTLGAPELVIIVAIWAVVQGLPIVLLWSVAKARGLSWAHALWGLFGWLGVVVGLLVMIVTLQPARREGRAEEQRPQSAASSGCVTADETASDVPMWLRTLGRRLTQFFRVVPALVLVALGFIVLVTLMGSLMSR